MFENGLGVAQDMSQTELRPCLVDNKRVVCRVRDAIAAAANNYNNNDDNSSSSKNVLC
jgi:hypothetical protein